MLKTSSMLALQRNLKAIYEARDARTLVEKQRLSGVPDTTIERIEKWQPGGSYATLKSLDALAEGLGIPAWRLLAPGGVVDSPHVVEVVDLLRQLSQDQIRHVLEFTQFLATQSILKDAVQVFAGETLIGETNAANINKAKNASHSAKIRNRRNPRKTD